MKSPIRTALLAVVVALALNANGSAAEPRTPTTEPSPTEKYRLPSDSDSDSFYGFDFYKIKLEIWSVQQQTMLVTHTFSLNEDELGFWWFQNGWELYADFLAMSMSSHGQLQYRSTLYGVDSLFGHTYTTVIDQAYETTW